MERTVSATEARTQFGKLIRQVSEEQQAIVVERGGHPQVVIVSIESYQRMKEAEEKRLSSRELLHHVREQVKEDLGGRALPSVAEIIQQMREERDDHILDLR